MDADRAHDDRGEDETGDRQANADSHVWESLLLHLAKGARSTQSKCLKWRGVRRVAPNPSLVSISRPVSRVL
jgi:hypothetical protein